MRFPLNRGFVGSTAGLDFLQKGQFLYRDSSGAWFEHGRPAILKLVQFSQFLRVGSGMCYFGSLTFPNWLFPTHYLR